MQNCVTFQIPLAKNSCFCWMWIIYTICTLYSRQHLHSGSLIQSRQSNNRNSYWLRSRPRPRQTPKTKPETLFCVFSDQIECPENVATPGHFALQSLTRDGNKINIQSFMYYAKGCGFLFDVWLTDSRWFRYSLIVLLRKKALSLVFLD